MSSEAQRIQGILNGLRQNKGKGAELVMNPYTKRFEAAPAGQAEKDPDFLRITPQDANVSACD